MREVVKKETVPNLGKKYGTKKPQPPVVNHFKVPKMADLWDEGLHYVRDMKPKVKTIANRSKEVLRPNLDILKIRDDFQKDPNLVRKISLPVSHIQNPRMKAVLRAPELYFFSHNENPTKISTTFFATRDALPIPHFRSTKLEYERKSTIHVPTLIDVVKDDLMVLAYKHHFDKSIRVLIYEAKECYAFPSDHPEITQERGKHIGFVNMLIKAVAVVSSKGEISDKWVGSENSPINPSIVECLIGEAIRRLKGEEIFVFRKVLALHKENLSYLSTSSKPITETQVHPDDFIPTLIDICKSIKDEALVKKGYHYLIKGAIAFHVTHQKTEEGLIETTVYYEIPGTGERRSLRTYSETSKEYFPESFKDIVNEALIGDVTPEEFVENLPQQFSLVLKL